MLWKCLDRLRIFWQDMRRISTITTVSSGRSSCQKIRPLRSSMMWTRERHGGRWSYLTWILCGAQPFQNQNKYMTSNQFFSFLSCQSSSSHSEAHGGFVRQATTAISSGVLSFWALSSISTGTNFTCVRRTLRLVRKLQYMKFMSQSHSL